MRKQYRVPPPKSGEPCPVCGEVNELADADGYTEEYPREWHAACAAFVSTLRTHEAIFDGGSDRSRVDVARE